jgi:sulfur carrier protein ThiS
VQLTVKLYGTLSRSFDAYDHKNGLGVSISQGASIHDLLVHLNLHPRGIGMIFMDGRSVKKDTRLKEGARIKIFQPIFGG